MNTKNHSSSHRWLTAARSKVLAMAVIGLAACSQTASDGENFGSQSQADVIFGPTKNLLVASTAWTGTQVELLAADAYFSCSFVRTYELNGGGSTGRRRMFYAVGDRFLEDLIPKMQTAEGLFSTPPGDVAHDWYATRIWLSDSTFDPLVAFDGGAEVPGLTFAQDPAATSLELALDTDFRTAGFNLCMAQLMRKHSPGSAANTGLFLPEAQQRQLLEIVRERSQIAMLQYALFASVLAQPVIPAVIPHNGFDVSRMGEISTWLHNLPDDVLAKYLLSGPGSGAVSGSTSSLEAPVA